MALWVMTNCNCNYLTLEGCQLCGQIQYTQVIAVKFMPCVYILSWAIISTLVSSWALFVVFRREMPILSSNAVLAHPTFVEGRVCGHNGIVSLFFFCHDFQRYHHQQAFWNLPFPVTCCGSHSLCLSFHYCPHFQFSTKIFCSH